MSTVHYRRAVNSGNGSPPPSWQNAVKRAIRDPRELCWALGLPPDFEAGAVAAAGSFPVFVPRGLLAKMRPGDPNDPILRQVLPRIEEMGRRPGELADPVGDGAAALSPGLLHKYAGRALMVTTGACAVHCRYCFRREFSYAETPRSVAEWEPGLAQIGADPSLHEIILSGGDPLMLVDDVLAELVERLAEIPHLRRLRIHTRLPIMIPERVTPELLRLLRSTRLTPIVVVHANHPAELDEGVAAALAAIIDAGIPVLNQAVLLRGVNDSADVLTQLCEQLVDLRVLPYYLHQLDRVVGTAHFEVPADEGRALVAELRRRLPGYAVPRYVQEIAGEEHKVPLE